MCNEKIKKKIFWTMGSLDISQNKKIREVRFTDFFNDGKEVRRTICFSVLRFPFTCVSCSWHRQHRSR